MIKLSFCLTRKDHLTREQFQDYWINKHAPLVKSVSKDLKIIKYYQIQSKTIILICNLSFILNLRK